MKKLLITLTAVVMLCSALVLGACASEYDHLADDLSELGLFKGGSTGYELDRAPNRAESVTMLVRLLGKEDEALGGEYTHPFTDVPEWAEGYIAYAFENGLTKGVTATEFNPFGQCTAQMFTTLVLRALGYSEEDGDFTYADALAAGEEMGVIDEYSAGDVFLRDNLVCVSYMGLFTPTRDGYTTLLRKLVGDGAVSEAKADPLLDRHGLYYMVDTAVRELKVTPGVSLSFDSTMTVKSSSYEGKTEAKIDINHVKGEDGDFTSSVRSDQHTTAGGETNDINEEHYYVDGVIYSNTSQGSYKLAATPEEAFDANMHALSYIEFYPFYAYKSFNTVEFDTYNIKISCALGETFYDGLVKDSEEVFGISDAKGVSWSCTYVLNILNSMKSLNSVETEDVFYGNADALGSAVRADLKINATARVEKFGPDVVVTYPDDLDSYIDFPGA